MVRRRNLNTFLATVVLALARAGGAEGSDTPTLLPRCAGNGCYQNCFGNIPEVITGLCTGGEDGDLCSCQRQAWRCAKTCQCFEFSDCTTSQGLWTQHRNDFCDLQCQQLAPQPVPVTINTPQPLATNLCGPGCQHGACINSECVCFGDDVNGFWRGASCNVCWAGWTGPNCNTYTGAGAGSGNQQPFSGQTPTFNQAPSTSTARVCQTNMACNSHGNCNNGKCECYADPFNGYWTGATCAMCLTGHVKPFCGGADQGSTNKKDDDSSSSSSSEPLAAWIIVVLSVGGCLLLTMCGLIIFFAKRSLDASAAYGMGTRGGGAMTGFGGQGWSGISPAMGGNGMNPWGNR